MDSTPLTVVITGGCVSSLSATAATEYNLRQPIPPPKTKRLTHSYQPFLEHEYNTSALVRDVVQPRILREGRRSIEIIKYPEDVRCNYAWVIGMSKNIVSGNVYGASNSAATSERRPRCCPDLILHIGMRTSYDGYCFETFARREGFEQPDDEGESFPKAMLQAGEAWESLPEKLYTKFNMDAVRATVLQKLPVFSWVLSLSLRKARPLTRISRMPTSKYLMTPVYTSASSSCCPPLLS